MKKLVTITRCGGCPYYELDNQETVELYGKEMCWHPDHFDRDDSRPDLPVVFDGKTFEPTIDIDPRCPLPNA